MIRAAALSYAIVFSLLIGLICSGVLFIAATQKQIEVIHNNKERVLFDSYAAVQYGIRNVQPNDSTTLYHTNGDTSIIRRKQWGAFDLVATQTFSGNQLQLRAAIIGLIQSPQLPCLYLPGNASGLKITGETKIEGTVYAPNSQVERAYVAGKNYAYTELIFGETKTAETTLPSLHAQWQNVTAQSFAENRSNLPYLAKDSTYSFQERTTCYQTLNPVIINEKLAGNVIIQSFDSIFVTAEAKLENIILIAPIVHFQEGFTGTVQVLAHEQITCEKHVKLMYPSVLILNELALRNEMRKRGILIDEQAMVLGGILMTTQSQDFQKLPFLEIRKDAVVAGLVYNAGETELMGSIFGSLYSQQLLARAGGGSYGNHLVDAKISSSGLPSYFLLPSWLEEQTKVKSKVISWL